MEVADPNSAGLKPDFFNSIGHFLPSWSLAASDRLGSNLAARFQSRERPELVLAADRSTSREGLDFDESTAVDPTQQPAARAIPPLGCNPLGGARPSHHQAAHRLGLQLDLLGYGKRVVYLDTELRVPEKQLH